MTEGTPQTVNNPEPIVAISAAMSEADWDRIYADERDHQMFLETKRYHLVREHVLEILQRSITRADPEQTLCGANRLKGRILAISGASGAGKTTTLQHAIQSVPSLRPRDGNQSCRPVLSINAPDQPSPSAIFGRFLQSINYPTGGSRSSEFHRQRFLAQARGLGTVVLHLDDCANMIIGQDAFRRRRSAQKVAACLRGLTEEEYPFSVILSGLDPMLEILEHDEALARRCQLIKLTPVEMGEDKMIAIAIAERARERGIEPLVTRELIARLLHASNYQFGLSLELAWHAISRAQTLGATSLEACHFADAYFRRTACDAGLNVFEVSDWARIDTKAIIPRLETTSAPRERARR